MLQFHGLLLYHARTCASNVLNRKDLTHDGIDAAAVRDTVQDAYDALPKVGYLCEPTRTNRGVCFSPGPIADPAYNACIKQLRKYATRKGKGSLMSDGVSAANSAAF